jgi:tetratricopeptide (TPR) repeat protein
LYRFTGNAAEERRFLNLAVEEYERSYIHSDFIKADKEMSEARILYLIGELMRRVERYDQAIRYFSKAVALKDRTIETGIIRMAHDQWSLAREEYRQKQQQII